MFLREISYQRFFVLRCKTKRLLVTVYFFLLKSKNKNGRRSPETQAHMLAIKKPMHKSNYVETDCVALNISTSPELQKGWV